MKKIEMNKQTSKKDMFGNPTLDEQVAISFSQPT